MRAAAAEASSAAPRTPRPTEIVAVGGTASNLLKVLPEAIADRILTRERIAEIQAILAHGAGAAAAERHRVNPIRARLLPAGGAIVDAHPGALRRGRDPGLRGRRPRGRRSSPSTTAGRRWRDRLPDLAHGWRT